MHQDLINSSLMVDSATPAPERARLGAELQQLDAGDKFTEITGPWWRPACPKTGLAISSQARNGRMWCTTSRPSWQKGCWR